MPHRSSTAIVIIATNGVTTSKIAERLQQRRQPSQAQQLQLQLSKESDMHKQFHPTAALDPKELEARGALQFVARRVQLPQEDHYDWIVEATNIFAHSSSHRVGPYPKPGCA